MTKEDLTWSPANEFEYLYLQLREKEGRIYKDEELALLPYIDADHPKHREWKIRTKSFKKLLRYIKLRLDPGINILEVGCGNGWLSSQLAKHISGTVTGTDINRTELQQAKRVFHAPSNLHFIEGDTREGILENRKFDLIVFASSIQYFSPLQEIIGVALKHLTTHGEIHILDSPFYKLDDLAAARQRTKDYYDALGFAELANHYYHHSIKSLDQYEYTILQDPYSWKNKLKVIKNPFYWIVIKSR